MSGGVTGHCLCGAVAFEYDGEVGPANYCLGTETPDLVFVKAGVLDDPRLVKPTHQTWIASAVPWRHIPVDLPGFQHGPE